MISGALLPAAALAAAPALAAGAIAYSPETGGWGISEAASRAAAESEAREGCAAFGGGCVSAVSFEGVCGALARGGSAAIWGAAAAEALVEAEAEARARCARLGGGCSVAVSLCADR